MRNLYSNKCCNLFLYRITVLLCFAFSLLIPCAVMTCDLLGSKRLIPNPFNFFADRKSASANFWPELRFESSQGLDASMTCSPMTFVKKKNFMLEQLGRLFVFFLIIVIKGMKVIVSMKRFVWENNWMRVSAPRLLQDPSPASWCTSTSSCKPWLPAISEKRDENQPWETMN